MRSPLWVLPVLVLATGCHSPEAVPKQPKEIVDLSPALSEDSPCRQLGHRTCDFLGVARQTFAPVVPTNPNYAFGMMSYSLLSHGGAHLDASARLLRDGMRADQVSLDRFYGPARVWDLRWHDRNTLLQVNDLGQQPPVLPGEVLLLLTGYTPPPANEWPVYSALSPQAASWLVARAPRAVGTDMPSLGSFEHYAQLLELSRSPDEVWAETLPFFQAGIPVIEGLINLEQLVDKPAVTFAGFPLAVADRSGAPMRAVALVY
ncbi:MAG: cyclase family protein [Deltaproteobacteria bacterium]|nr:cyclase family protein [Deltaproteobacteria bacterium]MBI3389702.1 cyclase family protein [Deltaproteobacteria bacterium]